VNDVLTWITQNKQNIVYILWGELAKSAVLHLVDMENNCVLTHSHPSPLSRKTFVGNNHFKRCNEYLSSHNLTEINWLQ